MFDTEVEEFDEEECIEFALALQQKAENEVLQSGGSIAEAKRSGQNKYYEVCKRYTLEFIKKIEEKLDALSNQSIANLLRMLIALGLDIEDEEELEYWINRLTKESLNRVTMYFNERDNISLWRQLISKPDSSKLLFNLTSYSIKDIKALQSIMKSLNILNDKNYKIEAQFLRRKDILEKINKTIDNDLKLKKQHQRLKNNKKSRKQSRGRSDTEKMLMNKMAAEGIEFGSRYWNEVIGEHNRATDKVEFVKNWQIDKERHNELDIKPINDKKREDERALAENEEHQRQELEKQRKNQQEQEELRQQELQEIKRKQEEQSRQEEQERQKRERDKIQEKRGVKESSETQQIEDKAKQNSRAYNRMMTRSNTRSNERESR